MASFNQRVNALLRECKNKKELIKKAEPYGLKFTYTNTTKKNVATEIVKAQDKQASEQKSKTDQPVEPVKADQITESTKPVTPQQPNSDEFLNLTESPDVPIIEENRGGKRDNAGRPEGQTIIHAKVDRCRAIPKSDPTIFFFCSGLFSFWALKTDCLEIAEQCDPKAESLALSITKFMRYQWPEFSLDPRIEFGCGILKEMRESFLWGKGLIDKKDQKPKSDQPAEKSENFAQDISNEVYPENDGSNQNNSVR